MTKEQLSNLLEEVFIRNPDGAKVFELIRIASGYDNATKLAKDDRTQAYKLGRADLFAELLHLVNYNKTKGKKE
jgi:hypothetical protein